MRFELTDNQLTLLHKFITEQDAKVVEMQGGEPYYGACGGSLTYMFTPTSLGLCVSVRHAITNEEINLTNYEEW